MKAVFFAFGFVRQPSDWQLEANGLPSVRESAESRRSGAAVVHWNEELTPIYSAGSARVRGTCKRRVIRGSAVAATRVSADPEGKTASRLGERSQPPGFVVTRMTSL